MFFDIRAFVKEEFLGICSEYYHNEIIPLLCYIGKKNKPNNLDLFFLIY